MITQNVWLVVRLGCAQTLAWASTYYLPAMLAAPMARDLGVSVPWVFAAFSGALVVSGLLGPRAGWAIDRWGGRPVLMVASLCFALGLMGLSQAQGPVGLVLAWLVIGLAMGAGLYEAAFATLVRLQGHGARATITGITLVAGFASTVGWPLSAWLEAEHGWRTACMVWAALHLLLGLPLNASLPRSRRAPTPVASVTESVVVEPAGHPVAPMVDVHSHRRAMALLSFVFAATWFISTAMAAHLPGLLIVGGVEAATAVWVGMLIGPAQVAGRLLEFGLLQRVHPMISARIAAMMHPVGATLMATGFPWAPAGFGVLHGLGNGVLTIAKGTLPLAIFGAEQYGHRQGWLMVPARMAQAAAPWLFGVAVSAWGLGALVLTAGVGGLACVALWAIPTDRRAAGG